MMVWRNSIRTLPLLLALPGSALALGLGDIHTKSTLNAPLLAEIDLVGATPEELSSLKATIASRDTFTRYGLDYPNYLTGISLQTIRTSDGRNVIQLKSADSIVEPFAILLVEVNWARGRMVREYTVLLDPPVFAGASANAQAAAVAAPTTGAGERSGAVNRSAAAPAATSAPGRSTGAAGSSAASGSGLAGTTYQVRGGDTLSAIGARVYGGSGASRDQALVGIYRANTGAFNGNMNELRRGAELNLPAVSDVQAIGSAAASAEVRSQYAAWNASHGGKGAAAAGSSSGQLKLVPPESASTATAPGAGTGAAGSSAASGSKGSAASGASAQQVQQLQAQIAEQNRAIELKNAEIAALQARLGAATAPAAAAPKPATAEPVTPPAATATTPAATPPAATTPAPAATTAAAPAPQASTPAPAATPAPVTESPSLLDTVLNYWWAIALVIAAIAVWLGAKFVRSRREQDFDNSLDRLMPSAGDFSGSGDTASLRAIGASGGLGTRGGLQKESFVVEESGPHEQPRIDQKASTTGEHRAIKIEDTVSGDTAVALDQGDPLAEADFHMAYGLYDQAADLIRIAMAREPGRRDLKLKLLEVFFVWGNREQFLNSARELAASRKEALPGEWEKIVIMGRQIAPEDPLFSESGAVAGAAVGGVDLNLEGGQNRVDFDLLGEPTLTPLSDPAAGMDLDVGAALGASEPTAESQQVDEGVDFVLDDPGRGSEDETGSTREMPADANEAPTVEQPAIKVGDNPTIREKLEAPIRQTMVGADQTAELALDDLGLDLSGIDHTGIDATGIDATGQTPALGEDAPTMLAPAMKDAAPAPTESGTWLFTDEDLSELAAEANNTGEAATLQVKGLDQLPGAGPTAQFEAFKSEGVDLDFGSLDGDAGSTASQKAAGVDLDVGPARVENDPGETARTQNLSATGSALPELEPVTMSEVGTKLDLARAYMDMGDPEGARSILDEVLAEGSMSQKQEARRLMDTLPG
ncbi:MAG TPA: FimV/HubP family polar landmark protein [Steroidobacteraceae bacterium]|nr:FimV/HubP family polar landmark protein [Steroidobacteraceae bacterium]